jgi:hypothetical protein
VFVVRLSKSVGRGQTKVSVKLGLCALKQKKSVRGELVEPWTDLGYNGNYETMSDQSVVS